MTKSKSDILSQLRRAGLNLTGLKETKSNYMVLCCFHSEKTPSLSIQKETGLFFCFGCKEKGSFKTLLKHLGARPESENKTSEESVKLAQVFSKFKSPEQKLVTSARELVLEEIDFEWRGFDPEFLAECGCKFWNQIVGTSKINFIPRIWIPIVMRGIQVGYTSRTIEKDLPKSIPKYKNNDDLVAKQVFLGYDSVEPGYEVLLCEGPVDYLRLRQLGFQALSILGTGNWSETKLGLLIAKSPEKVFICMDGDIAGAKAQKEIYKNVNEYIDCEIVHLPDNKDPGNVSVKFWDCILPEVKKIRQK